MKQRIKGRVVYQDLGGGFWGIEGEDGRQYLPTNMPEQLKLDGAKVEITAVPSDMESIFMWGESIKIVGFHTLPKL